MRLTWDEVKNRANSQKHKINFVDAIRVFDDKHAFTVPDPYPGEARSRTYGAVNNILIVVIHTEIGEDPNTGEQFGRIISARAATRYERRSYEEGFL